MPKYIDHEARKAEVAAAVVRVAQGGLDAVTLRAVSKESGWSTGSIAHYFPDKESLLEAAFALITERSRRSLAKVLIDGDRDPILRLRDFLDAKTDNVAGQPDVMVWFAFLGRALIDRELGGHQQEAYEAWVEMVRSVIEEAQAAGDIESDRDDTGYACLLLALVDGFFLQQSFMRDYPPNHRDLARGALLILATRQGRKKLLEAESAPASAPLGLIPIP
ncbi:TetR/AcrR family transcriptional regulator [Dietzia lutea]|uniref:HTH tetR-type domain-containing protein n=1 Tax=Dietzia lutea TaxID=546160 RepID=A0A2S1RCW5_9ACTN|nr:TetR/AcrR family transcriptional regulator [Dietzia lutea]AWH94114.1 hypothetical protein A6035_17335 [Dietzia lutea]